MCKFVVLLDHDRAGKESADRAIENGVLRESEVKYTICNGSPESEFEDCIKPNIAVLVFTSIFDQHIQIAVSSKILETA